MYKDIHTLGCILVQRRDTEGRRISSLTKHLEIDQTRHAAFYWKPNGKVPADEDDGATDDQKGYFREQLCGNKGKPMISS